MTSEILKLVTFHLTRYRSKMARNVYEKIHDCKILEFWHFEILVRVSVGIFDSKDVEPLKCWCKFFCTLLKGKPQNRFLGHQIPQKLGNRKKIFHLTFRLVDMVHQNLSTQTFIFVFCAPGFSVFAHLAKKCINCKFTTCKYFNRTIQFDIELQSL